MEDITQTLLRGGVKERSSGGLAALAEKLKVEVATVMAIVDVESGGSGIDGSGRVKVLFEKHKFYKHLPKEKRDAAVKAGLARKNWISPKDGGYKDQPNNGAALELLTKAIAIDETAALKSASYGAGQVLGENYGLCGWPSVQAFVMDMCESEDNHVAAMMGFLTGNGLADELRAKDFDAVARVYNGAGQVKTYGAKLRAAYHRYAGAAPKIEDAVRETGLRVGSTGYRVEALQKRLNEIGFPVKVDSDFGTTTRRAVMAFQAEKGLDVDGVVGPATQRALDVAESSIPEARANATIDDLRKQDSTIVKTADKQQAVGIIGGGLSAAVAAQKAGLFDSISSTADSLSGLSAFAAPLQSIIGLVSQYWWLAAGAGGVAVFMWARAAKRARLEDYRTGRTV